jgi:hypothetical protein
MNLKIKDEYGIVTEAARRREMFAKKVDRRADDYILSPQGQARIARVVDARIAAEADAIMARRVRERMEVAVINQPTGPQVGEVMATVCDVTGCSLPAMTGPRRSRNIAWPRHLAMYILIKTREDLSLPAIGHAFGGRDHTTVMHAKANVLERMDDDPFSRWFLDPRIAALMAMAPETETRIPRPHKITAEQARAIRFSRKTEREIASEYGISKAHAGDVRRGRAWKDAA